MKILIAIHDLEQAETTLSFAAQIVHRAGEAPTILFVIEHKTEKLDTQVEDMLEKAQEILGVPKIITKVRTGNTAQEIIRETEQGGYDLLIKGEIKTNNLARRIKGATTIGVVDHISCPVIIAKGAPRPIRHILLCDSGAGRSSVLNRFTAQLSEMLEGEEAVCVLHVMSQISAGPGVIGKHLRASVGELIEEQTPEGVLLERDILELEKSGVHPTPIVRHGLVVDEILAEVSSGNYDLLVIGASKGKKWQHYLLEDLARKILLKSDHPVLVIN